MHPSFEIRSHLAAPYEDVWGRVASFEGINDELGPWLRMTAPREARNAGLSAVPLGKPWFRSWLLLFGVVPVDYDHLCILSLEDGRFVEESTMLSAHRWRHERTVKPVDGGCVVEDRVSWHPRTRLLGMLLGFLVPRVFAHRHAVLRRRFGHLEAPLARAARAG
jgi:ligand-binding SRPBCC domain-containing protein